MRSAVKRARVVGVAAALGLALGVTGCFASWGAVQISGNARMLEEGAREVSVPLPGVKEVLAVHLPLADDKTSSPETTAATAGAATSATPRVLELGCETTQHATNNVYRSAFRYGKTWKYATAAMFALEAGVAAAFHFGIRDDPQYQLAAGVLAVDALGTAALFFAPRKELYRTEVRPAAIRVRTDCPDGLALDIGGEVYPVDAAGRIGELGAAALDAWMQAPGAPVRIAYAGRTVDMPLGQPELCVWNNSHHPEPAAATNPGAAPTDPATPATPAAAAPSGTGAQQPVCPRGDPRAPRQVSARIEVPLGTLTRVDATPAAP
jgi:hypothetical protein